MEIKYNQIRNRLIIIFCVAVTIIILVVLFLNYQTSSHIKRKSQLASIINVSGKQRMMSQNITKNGLLYLHSDTESAKRGEYLENVNTLLVEFRDKYFFLSKRKNQYQNGRLDSLFYVLEPAFFQLIDVCHMLDEHNQSRDDLKKLLLKSESQFLPIMDQITYELELESERALGRINYNVSISHYLIVLVVFLSSGVVLIITLNKIKSYADSLGKLRSDLADAFFREQKEVDKFHFLAETVNIGIWERDPLKNEEKWSAQLFQLLEYSPDEIEGSTKDFLQLVHPDDRDKLKEASKRSIASGKASTIEIRVKTKSLSYKWFEASGNARLDDDNNVELLIGGLIEITNRKVLEKQLKAFIDRAPAAIAMFDRNMKYMLASRKWIEDYNLQGQQIIGISHYEIFPEIGEEWKAIYQRCLNGAIDINEEARFPREDGSTEYLKWEVRPWYLTDTEIGGILIFTEDVTRQKLEKEELKKAKEEAMMASKAKEQFLATMSHEIRTPLNAINGIAHILLLEDPREDQVEYLNLLRFSGNNLLTLINDILDISKIESGKLELNYAPFDFYYLVSNVKNSLEFKANENLVVIQISYDEELPHVFLGDATRLTQILYNLIGNAIKFSSGGKVSISISLVKSHAGKYEILISVKDTGIGIAKENQEKIFEPFEQAESGTVRKYGGSGLGLYITKELLSLMGSEIQIESELGKGAKFFFTLSLEKSDDLVDQMEILPKKAKSEDLDICILVVEDNSANQIIIKKVLKQLGMRCDIAENGEVALEKVEDKVYDLVLMDLQMPVMDGYTATRKIRAKKDAYHQSIPIIALTADAFQDIKIQAKAAGMNDHLSKPFKPSELYELIKRYSGKVEKEAKMSRIAAFIEKEGEGDAEFREVFSGHCIENYQELINQMHKAKEENDKEVLRLAIHKIKGLNTMFGLEEFQAKLEAFQQNKDLFNKEAELKEIEEQTAAILEELNQIKTS